MHPENSLSRVSSLFLNSTKTQLKHSCVASVLACNVENIICPICEPDYKKLSKSSDNGKAFSLKDNILQVSNDDREIGCIILKLYKQFWKCCLILEASSGILLGYEQLFTKSKFGNKN